jgi:hypothetical protein
MIMSKEELKQIYEEVLTTTEAVREYEIIAFGSPFAEVRRRSDGQKGTLEFHHSPRFYFNFIESKSS